MQAARSSLSCAVSLKRAILSPGGRSTFATQGTHPARSNSLVKLWKCAPAGTMAEGKHPLDVCNFQEPGVPAVGDCRGATPPGVVKRLTDE